MANQNQALATNGEDTQTVKSVTKTMELFRRPTKSINTNDPKPPTRTEHRAAPRRMVTRESAFIVRSSKIEFVRSDDDAAPASQET